MAGFWSASEYLVIPGFWFKKHCTTKLKMYARQCQPSQSEDKKKAGAIVLHRHSWLKFHLPPMDLSLKSWNNLCPSVALVLRTNQLEHLLCSPTKLRWDRWFIRQFGEGEHIGEGDGADSAEHHHHKLHGCIKAELFPALNPILHPKLTCGWGLRNLSSPLASGPKNRVIPTCLKNLQMSFLNRRMSSSICNNFHRVRRLNSNWDTTTADLRTNSSLLLYYYNIFWEELCVIRPGLRQRMSQWVRVLLSLLPVMAGSSLGN